MDLTDVKRRIIGVHETIPVRAGGLTLLYPKWIPGNHSPTGPISKVAGLVVTANDKRLDWLRDPIHVYAFRIEIPAGVGSIEVAFQYLEPMRSKEGRISISSEIADLAWNTVALYPAGYFSRRIHVAVSVKLPPSWKYATALATSSREGNVVHFKETTFNTLVDSPLYAGINFKRVDL